MNHIESYLTSCRTPSIMEDLHDLDGMKPPTAQELRALIAYLTGFGLRPLVAGSASAFHHLILAFGKKSKRDISNLWRPTKDVDLWVSGKLPAPPAGWKRDPEAIGTPSWISPSGGYVDFMIEGDTFPSGGVTGSMSASDDSPEGVPTAGIFDVLRSKLATGRIKDLGDVIDLMHAIKAKPAYAAKIPGFLKSLSSEQKEDFNTAVMYFDLKYTGNLNLPGMNKSV